MMCLKLSTIGMLLLALAIYSSANVFASPEVCGGSSIDKIVKATTPQVQLQITRDVLGKISPAILQTIPVDKLTGDPDGALYAVYNALAEELGRRSTAVEFNGFIEAVNEISVAQAEACSGSAIYDSSDVQTLAQKIMSVLSERKKDLQMLRSIFGKLLCIDTKGTDGTRKRRQDSVDHGCPLREDCECPSDGIYGICPICEFFACLDPGNVLGPIFGFKSLDPDGEQCLAFVVDTTGSMSNEIEATKQIINEFIKREEDLGFFGCYILVPFGDVDDTREAHIESVDRPIIAYSVHVDDLIKFLEAVNSLAADGGGDRREYSLYAMLVALKANGTIHDYTFPLMVNGSQMVVITDAPSKQPEKEAEVISTANDLIVCIHFFLNHDPIDDGIYPRISEKTHGTLNSPLTNWDLARFVETYEEYHCSPRYTSPMSKRRRKRSSSVIYSSDTCRRFNVSKLAVLLKLSIQANEGSEVTVTRPNSTSSIIVVGKGDFAVFSEGLPQAGCWSACVNRGSFEVSKTERSSFDTAILYELQQGESSSILSTLPSACSVGKFVIVSSKSSDIQSATLSLLNMEGEPEKRVNLTVCSGLLVSNAVHFPLGLFIYQIDGLDTKGVSYQYNTKKNVVFTYSPGDNSLFSLSGLRTAEMDIHETLRLTYYLHNNAPYSSNFIIHRRRIPGFVYDIQPRQILVPAGRRVSIWMRMQRSSSSLRRGTEHTITVLAGNGCLNVSISTLVTIKNIATSPPGIAPETPPNRCGCVNGGTCIVITRRGRTRRRCACPPGFIGSKCQVDVRPKEYQTPSPPLTTYFPTTIISQPPTTTSMLLTTTSPPPTATFPPPITTSLPPTTTSLPLTTISLLPTTTSLPPTATSPPPTTTSLPPTTTTPPPITSSPYYSDPCNGIDLSIIERNLNASSVRILYLLEPGKISMTAPPCNFHGSLIVVSPHTRNLRDPSLVLIRVSPYRTEIPAEQLMPCADGALKTRSNLILSFAQGVFRYRLQGYDKNKKVEYNADVTDSIRPDYVDISKSFHFNPYDCELVPPLTFDCLDPDNVLKPIFGFITLDPEGEQCLAFVVDTTGSMRNEIDTVRRIINEFILREEELGFFGCYILVPFNDIDDTRDVHLESVGPVTIAYPFLPEDVRNFINAVNSLAATGGGDLAEYALYGMLVALRATDTDDTGTEIPLMVEGSQMIVITDAPSKQPDLEATVISEANMGQVCIHFFLSENPTGDGLYPRIHDATEGTLLVSNSPDFNDFELAKFVSTYEDNPCTYLTGKRRKRQTSGFRPVSGSPVAYSSELCRSFSVSKLAVLLKLSIQANEGSEVTVTRPNGISSIIAVGRGDFAVFSEGLPQAGSWSACVNGGSFEVSKTERSTFDTTFFYQIVGSESVSSILPAACSLGKAVIVSSRSRDIRIATLSIINSAGEAVRSSNLTKCNNDSLVSDIINFPHGSFTYHIDGVDTNGVNFHYSIDRNITFTPSDVTLFSITGQSTAEMDLYQTLRLNFSLYNSAPYELEFSHSRRRVSGFASRAQPAQVVVPAGGSKSVQILVRVSSSSIRRETEHLFEVIASNGCVDVSASTTVTIKKLVIPPPPSVPTNDCGCMNGGTCVTIIRRGRTSRRCTCPPVFRGRKCQIDTRPPELRPTTVAPPPTPTTDASPAMSCDCLNNGTCITLGDGVSMGCECPSDYRGLRCEYLVLKGTCLLRRDGSSVTLVDDSLAYNETRVFFYDGSTEAFTVPLPSCSSAARLIVLSPHVSTLHVAYLDILQESTGNVFRHHLLQCRDDAAFVSRLPIAFFKSGVYHLSLVGYNTEGAFMTVGSRITINVEDC